MPTLGSAITVLGTDTRAAALENLAAAGVSFVRYDFLWERMEPEPGRYDFTAEDAIVSQAREAGLGTRAILAYGNPHYSAAGGTLERAGAGGGLPPFGVGSAHYFPPDPEHLPAYRRFAEAVADRFAGRVDDWEIWNEENVGARFWPPKEDPDAYATLLRTGAEGLRAGNPDVTVSSGGVFYPEVPPNAAYQGGLEFLRNVYDADPALGEVLDVVAWHPYQYPFVAPELGPPRNASVPESADEIDSLLERRGDGSLDRWVTELGWPTHDSYGVSERRQAAYLVRAITALWVKGVDSVVWYTYADGPNADQNQEDAFGLVRYDGTPKPSYHALSTLTDVLDGCVFAGPGHPRLSTGDGSHVFRFTRQEQGRGAPQVTVLWTAPETLASDYGPLPATDDRRTVRLETRRPVEVVDTVGGRERRHPEDGEVTVGISPFPTYLVERGR